MLQCLHAPAVSAKQKYAQAVIQLLMYLVKPVALGQASMQNQLNMHVPETSKHAAELLHISC